MCKRHFWSASATIRRVAGTAALLCLANPIYPGSLSTIQVRLLYVEVCLSSCVLLMYVSKISHAHFHWPMPAFNYLSKFGCHWRHDPTWPDLTYACGCSRLGTCLCCPNLPVLAFTRSAQDPVSIVRIYPGSTSITFQRVKKHMMFLIGQSRQQSKVCFWAVLIEA